MMQIRFHLPPGPGPDLDVSFLDLCGRVVSSMEVHNPVSHLLKINTSGLENGVYLLRVRTAAANRTVRILVRHPE
jgi:hypothetical protein